MAQRNSRIIALDATLIGGTYTGDSVYWTNLVRALSRIEHEFEFLLLSQNSPKEINLSSENFRLVTLPKYPKRWLSWVTMPLLAKKLGAEAFHTQYTLSPFAKNGITTIHDVSFFLHPEWFRFKDRFLLRTFVPGSAKRAKKVITVSEASKKDIVRYLNIPENKVSVTPLGVNENFFPRNEKEISEVLKKYGVERPYLLCVGTRWPRKNIALVIQAMRFLPVFIPHKLYVVGKAGWGDEPYHPRVRFLGYVSDEDLPALYTAADIYLCPSLYEGFGLTVLEAFACGTPVITSVAGGLCEVAGDAAVTMENMTAEAWAEAIRALLADSSKISELKEKGFARAKLFNWQKTAELTLEVYREVVG
ncbi:MAG TPA: glycosyltransferase family 1 protein [Fimbriimonadales bacterium]|nr:glycosyltransferase family 1 protein [Fimbriimonadales bacterium]